jgi:hypothetical protein
MIRGGQYRLYTGDKYGGFALVYAVFMGYLRGIYA